MNSDQVSDLRPLALGMRMFASSVTLIFAYVNTRLAFQTGWFRQFFVDALPGKKLPELTNFIMQFHVIWIVLSLLFPIASMLCTILVKSDKRALQGLTVILVLSFIQLHLTFSAFNTPLWGLVTGMRDD